MFKFKIDDTFLGLNIILVVLNLFYWAYSTIPVHDSFNFLQMFHLFYREFLLNGELPRWLPYGFYGRQSDFFALVCFSPAQYFAMFLGKIFNIQNTFYLFLFSIYLEQLQLLTGSYLLARKVLRHKISIILFCAGIFLSSFWYIQISYNLRIFLFLPLTLFLLLKFLDNFNFFYIGIAGIIILFSLFGSPVYFGVLFIYITLLFLLCCLLTGNYLKTNKVFLSRNLKKLLNPWSVLFCFIFIIITLCYLSMAFKSLDFNTLAPLGRDPDTKKVTLEVFLTYGGPTSIFRYLEFIWGTGFSEAVVYIGLIPIVFFLYSVFFVRNTIFYTSLICLLVILAVGLGRQGLIAPIIYYLPLFNYSRHIGLFIPIAKIFLLLCASLGIDHFFESSSLKKQKNKRKAVIICSILIVFVASLYFLFNSHPVFLQFPYHTLNLNPYFLNGFAIALLLVFLVLNVYSYYKYKRTMNSIIIGSLLILYLLDMFSWHLSYIHSIDNYSTKNVKPFIVKDYPFQMERFENKNQLTDNRSLLIFQELVGSKPPFAIYEFITTFADADFCFPIHQQVFWTKFVNDFLEERVAFNQKQTGKLPENRKGFYGTIFPNSNDHLFYKTIGCTAPKIRLAIPSENLRQEFHKDDVTTILQTVENPNTIIVNGYGDNKASEILEDLNYGKDISNDLITVSIADFSVNSLKLYIELKKETQQPLWLIYADAFHPSWKSFINEKETQVFIANSAFKAIKLTDLKMGTNHVSFRFEHLPKVRTFLFFVLVIFSCGFIMLTGMILVKNK